MEKTTKSGFRVLRGMLIYALIFAVIAAAALFAFAKYISQYELSRPDNIADEWFENISREDIDGLTEGLISKLNTEIVSEKELSDLLADRLFGSASLARSPAESTDNKKVYLIKSAPGVVGKLILTANGQTGFGFNSYEVKAEPVDLSFLTSSQQFTIPDTWTVSLNGMPLDGKYISGVRDFELWEEFYDNDEFTLPRLAAYDTGLYIDAPELLISSPDGRTFTEASALGETVFADNCSEDMKQRIYEETEVFIDLYMTYSSNYNGVTYGNYYRLCQHVVPDSSLQKRLHDAAAGLGWAQSRSEKLLGIDYHTITDLGGGMYFVDLTYRNRTLGNNGYVEFDNHMKIIYAEQPDGVLLAATLSTS